MAVVFISSEIEEMLRTCDRMVVMRDGAKVGELSGNEMNQSSIMSTIAGGSSHEKQNIKKYSIPEIISPHFLPGAGIAGKYHYNA